MHGLETNIPKTQRKNIPISDSTKPVDLLRAMSSDANTQKVPGKKWERGPHERMADFDKLIQILNGIKVNINKMRLEELLDIAEAFREGKSRFESDADFCTGRPELKDYDFPQFLDKFEVSLRKRIADLRKARRVNRTYH